MLLEKTQELVELSKRKQDLQIFLDSRKIIQDRKKKIDQSVANILPMVETFKTFRQRGIVGIDVTKKIDHILSLILSIEQKLTENHEWIFEPENTELNNLKSHVETLKTTLEQQLSKVWKSYRDQQMPSTNSEILNLLAKVEAFRPTVLQIQIIDREIKNVTYPKNNAEFATYEHKIEQLKLHWNSLSSDEVPADVLNFLRAAANQGAPLNLWTPEVKDWINQHSIADSLKIRLL